MKQSRILLIPLLGVLSVQIFTLSPALHIPSVTQGVLSENIRREGIELKRRVEDTLFSAKPIASYDSLVLVGDIMLGRNVEVLMKRESSSYPFEGLALETLAPNPAIIGNFESAMASPHVPTEALQMRFSVDEVFLPALAAAGYTHVSQANNHSLDYGNEGFTHARDSLLRSGTHSFGHYTDLSKESITYVESKQGTVALVGINASASIPQTRDIEAVLDEATQHSTMQIVYVHWGTEYETVHSRAQELFATELVAAGADLIVGHHPHVVQDIGVIDGVIVFYSLGNYIFDQYFSAEVQQGLVLTLSLDENPVLMLVPVSSVGALSQPTLMSPQLHREFLDDLADRSDVSLMESIKRGVLPLSPLVATSTKMAMMMR